MDFDMIFERFVIKNCKRNKKGKFFRTTSLILNSLARLFYSCDISPFATIGNIKIPHCVGIVIGHTAVLEDDVIIMPNVVVGGRYGTNIEKRRGHAHIKRGCIIGANATILGRVTIGEYATIGAGAVITKDIPPMAVVTANNKIIRYKTRKEIENMKL